MANLTTSAWLLAVLLGACGAAPSSTTTTEQASVAREGDQLVSTSETEGEPSLGVRLPDDLHGTVEVGRATACHPIEPTVAIQQDVASFNRWLRDQSVGRHVVVEELGPLCHAQDATVVNLTLTGPAGGLQSMGRALQAYYPRSQWKIRHYERLQGHRLPLRVCVEVLLHRGDRPRPRCEWDPDVSCPPPVSPGSVPPGSAPPR
jgi:hypothetical protein